MYRAVFPIEDLMLTCVSLKRCVDLRHTTVRVVDNKLVELTAKTTCDGFVRSAVERLRQEIVEAKQAARKVVMDTLDELGAFSGSPVASPTEKEMPPHEFVIYDAQLTTPLQRYWNQDMGWGSLETATRYTKDGKRLAALPTGGAWRQIEAGSTSPERETPPATWAAERELLYQQVQDLQEDKHTLLMDLQLAGAADILDIKLRREIAEALGGSAARLKRAIRDYIDNKHLFDSCDRCIDREFETLMRLIAPREDQDVPAHVDNQAGNEGQVPAGVAAVDGAAYG